MAAERRQGDRRRAPRFETRLWVGIPEVAGEPELEKCDISAAGLLLWTRRDAGEPGAVRMLRLVTADLGAGINIMAHVVRVVAMDDLDKGRVIEATAFEFLPHDPQELEAFLRQVVEGEISVAPNTPLEHRFPAQMDRREGGAVPAMVNSLSVSGMLIDTNCPVEAGTTVSVEIKAPAPERALQLCGQVVRSRPVEDFGGGDHYRVEVSFSQENELGNSSAAEVLNSLVSEAATTDRPGRKREGVHLSGSLSEVALPSLLAFLELERSSGVLGIEHDSNKACVFVQHGRVLDIELDALDSSPIEALADLLGFTFPM